MLTSLLISSYNNKFFLRVILRKVQYQTATDKFLIVKNLNITTFMWSCSVKKVFLKILPEACNIIKRETLPEVLSSEFCEIFQNTFFSKHNRVTASGYPLAIKSTYCIDNAHIASTLLIIQKLLTLHTGLILRKYISSTLQLKLAIRIQKIFKQPVVP